MVVVVVIVAIVLLKAMVVINKSCGAVESSKSDGVVINERHTCVFVSAALVVMYNFFVCESSF